MSDEEFPRRRIRAPISEAEYQTRLGLSAPLPPAPTRRQETHGRAYRPQRQNLHDNPETREKFPALLALLRDPDAVPDGLGNLWAELFRLNSRASPKHKLSDPELGDFVRILYPRDDYPGNHPVNAARWRKKLGGERYVKLLRYTAPRITANFWPIPNPAHRVSVTYAANAFGAPLRQVWPDPDKIGVLWQHKYARRDGSKGFGWEHSDRPKRSPRAKRLKKGTPRHKYTSGPRKHRPPREPAPPTRAIIKELDRPSPPG